MQCLPFKHMAVSGRLLPRPARLHAGACRHQYLALNGAAGAFTPRMLQALQRALGDSIRYVERDDTVTKAEGADGLYHGWWLHGDASGERAEPGLGPSSSMQATLAADAAASSNNRRMLLLANGSGDGQVAGVASQVRVPDTPIPAERAMGVLARLGLAAAAMLQQQQLAVAAVASTASDPSVPAGSVLGLGPGMPVERMQQQAESGAEAQVEPEAETEVGAAAGRRAGASNVLAPALVQSVRPGAGARDGEGVRVLKRGPFVSSLAVRFGAVLI